MFLLPKNQTYKSEAIAKTVVAPILLLVLSILSFVIWNPFVSPQIASLLGMSKSIDLKVESTELKNPLPVGNGWKCDHWVADGSYNGKDYYTRACNDQAPTPQVGDTLKVMVAPASNEAYLTARGAVDSFPQKILIFFVYILATYGVIVSLRLFYIGYSSNWRK